MTKKYMILVWCAIIGSLVLASPAIIIDGKHYTSMGQSPSVLVYDGVSVSYVFSANGKNSIELGGNFSFVSPISSGEYFREDSFNTVIKVHGGQIYDFTNESSLGLRVISRVGLVTANFDKFGLFYSIAPVFYVRVGFLSFGICAGLEIAQFFGGDTLPVFHAGGEITYRF